VYVLKDGMVVEQGFRYDLESEPGHGVESIGEFRKMVEVQCRTGGFLPEKPSFDPSQENLYDLLDADGEEEPEPTFNLTIKHQSLARPSLRPLTLGNWMFDVVSDLTATKPLIPGSAVVKARDAKRVSRFMPIAADAFTGSMGDGTWRRPTSIQVIPYSPTTSAVTRPLSAHTVASPRFSLQFSPTVSNWSVSRAFGLAEEWDEEELKFEKEKRVVEMSGSRAIGSREKGVRRRWDDVKIHPKDNGLSPEYEHEDQFQRPAFWGILREIFPTIPYKPLLFLGLFTCLANGAMTPVFSFLLSHLLFEVSTGAHNVSTINFFGGLVLGVAALDGLLMGFKYFLMETAGNAWVLRIQQQAFANVLAQEKKWFDRRENTSVRLVQTLVKDGDDARNLVAVVMGEGCVVVAMVGVGLLWAMVRGWQLTLVGVAVAPVFAGMMALQAVLVAKCELRNKRAREEVAKGYYDVSFYFWLCLC
jgi:ATP-binding cassette subfamily B (MDR/TAP) protein 1